MIHCVAQARACARRTLQGLPSSAFIQPLHSGALGKQRGRESSSSRRPDHSGLHCTQDHWGLHTVHHIIKNIIVNSNLWYTVWSSSMKKTKAKKSPASSSWPKATKATFEQGKAIIRVLCKFAAKKATVESKWCVQRPIKASLCKTSKALLKMPQLADLEIRVPFSR